MRKQHSFIKDVSSDSHVTTEISHETVHGKFKMQVALAETYVKDGALLSGARVLRDVAALLEAKHAGKL